MPPAERMRHQPARHTKCSNRSHTRPDKNHARARPPARPIWSTVDRAPDCGCGASENGGGRVAFAVVSLQPHSENCTRSGRREAPQYIGFFFLFSCAVSGVHENHSNRWLRAEAAVADGPSRRLRCRCNKCLRNVFKRSPQTRENGTGRRRVKRNAACNSCVRFFVWPLVTVQ